MLLLKISDLRNLPKDLKRLMDPTFSPTQKEQDEIPPLKNHEGEERILCQRCYHLKYHNRIIISLSWQQTLTSDKSFLQFLRKKRNSVILTVIDIFDFPGSLT